MSEEVEQKAGRIVDFEYNLGVRLLNGALTMTRRAPLLAEELMSCAQKSTGLSDFGDRFFVEPLERLLEDAMLHTEFHPLGYHLLRKKIIHNLENRLWAKYWIDHDPSIIETPLPPIVLINGLQRTGTTFLQRLLGSLPEMRGIPSWETVNPVPRAIDKNHSSKYEAQIAHAAFNWINPEFKTIHSVHTDSLEEEVVLMDHSFVSTATMAILDVPEYASWLEVQDQKRYYQDLKMWLKILCWRRPAQQYLLLKSPHHMEHMEAFMHVFPQTQIIHTHRDPLETIPSYCSMVRCGSKLFQPRVDTHAIGDYWLAKDKRFVDRCMEYRESVDHRGFHDIAYRDFVGDPVTMVEHLYAHLSLDWTPAHHDTAQLYCDTHRKNKYGRHIYDMADYGLTAERINDAFSQYRVDYVDYL